MNRTDDEYGRHAGRDALDRQTAEAENRHACCGELRVSGHHPVCRNHQEPDGPAEIEGQETLL